MFTNSIYLESADGTALAAAQQSVVELAFSPAHWPPNRPALSSADGPAQQAASRDAHGPAHDAANGATFATAL